METTDYVSYPIALALKKAGFDWKCHYHYDSDRGSHIIEPNYTANDGEDCQYITADDLLEDNNGWQYCSAPTLAIAQKWLREVKRIEVNATWESIKRYWFFYTNLMDVPDIVNLEDISDSVYSTYEAALSAGIVAALELIEKEGE